MKWNKWFLIIATEATASFCNFPSHGQNFQFNIFLVESMSMYL